MQFDGGYDLRPLTWKVFVFFSIIISVFCFCLFLFFKKTFLTSLSLFFNLEGTLMWVSSLSPHGTLPPPKGWKEKITWFFQMTKGFTVAINPKMLYCGILFVMLSAILQALFLQN